MGGLHAPLDCLFELMAQHGFTADEVERIEVDVAHAVYHHGWWQLQRPITPIAAQMNIGYALAVALIDGAAMVNQFSPQRIDSDDVWRIIPKIAVRHDPEFDEGGPLKRGSTRMRVILTNGRPLETFRTVSKTIGEPMSNDAVVRKFHTLTYGLLADQRRQDIATAVLALDSMPDVTALIELLAPPVRGAFD
ncbi:MAG: hypothetical protein ACTS5I_03130 [Rhodanobacter sp.]